MSEYEGLNLPQLLELLKPPVMPEPIPLLPATPGWWVLGVWLLVVLALLGWRWRARWQANGYRRTALQAIDTIAGDPGSDAAAAIAAVVKRTALAAYPRAEVASLSGEAWAEFLVRTAPGDHRVADGAAELAGAAYRPTDPASIAEPARAWVRVHRA